MFPWSPVVSGRIVQLISVFFRVVAISRNPWSASVQLLLTRFASLYSTLPVKSASVSTDSTKRNSDRGREANKKVITSSQHWQLYFLNVYPATANESFSQARLWDRNMPTLCIVFKCNGPKCDSMFITNWCFA